MYDDNIALSLARHAINVYHRTYDTIGTSQLDCSECHLIQNGCTQLGIALTKDNNVIITPRGSSELGDWFENAMAFRLPKLGNGRVHFGFNLQFRRVRDQLCRSIEKIQEAYQPYSWQVTGHSLGAALGPFVVCCLRSLGIRNIAPSYFFNMPRVGNRDFSDWYRSFESDLMAFDLFPSETYRIVTINKGIPDLVTRIPISRWGWMHVGRPIILADGSRFESEDVWQAAKKANPIPVLAQWRIISRLSYSVQAHLGQRLLNELTRVVKPKLR